jgi:hypothetical protein
MPSQQRNTHARAEYRQRLEPGLNQRLLSAPGPGRRTRERGTVLTEAAAALVIMVPLAIVFIYVMIETSYAYFLKASLAQCSRQASRDLAIAYGSNPSIVFDRTEQEERVFNHIRLFNVVNSSAQFDNPEWNTGSEPHTVKVVVRYTSGENSLPRFPEPDPLNLGGSFRLMAESTHRLE